MIEQLQIKNIALIESAEIEFDKGLNILSGETGAGKSMLIDAINFLLGERPGKDSIRHGEQNASVNAIISVGKQVMAAISEMGIEADEDRLLHIWRGLNNQGKTSCKVNGKAITISMLRELSVHLADVHGQHEHQSLLDPNGHITLLDQFCGEGMDILKQQLSQAIKDYKEIVREIREIADNTKNLESHIDLLQQQKQEIDEAMLKAGEEESLLERRKILMSHEKLVSKTLDSLDYLNSAEDLDLSAADKIFKSANLINEIAKLDSRSKQLQENMESIVAQLEDLIRELRNYYENLEHDPTELHRVETRLDLIHNLKRKYGESIEQILLNSDKIGEQVESVRNSEAELKNLNKQKKEASSIILDLCQSMSKLRAEAADSIKSELVTILQDLGMKNVKFDVFIERKKEFSAMGYDKVEFLISPNLGEDLKPLAKIASGGEMSRVMLALKTVLADVDNVETFIFDEIDTGVSGRTAQKVAEKLAIIAKKHQILCITHLPQIAAMADRHFVIEKKTTGNRTTTSVYQLEKERSVSELARLIGGAKITSATMEAAMEMKNQAMQIKED